ncbi:MAG: LemA family protein [Thiobacillus sp.]|nr:LemA family protein [Thiobacillus sp.]
MSGAIIFWALVVIVLVYAIFVYNSLVQIKHNVSKAWSNIDVLLKQRHDELPKLVEACRQYKQFEQDTLRQVTEARAQVQSASQAQDIPALGVAESALRVGLGQIFAVMEAYPELRANEQFAQLMQRVTSLEEGIADRREFYNESVNINNVRIEQFPDNFVARLFSFGPRPLLTFKADDLKDVDIKKLFG